jgi:hypothetical protein
MVAIMPTTVSLSTDLVSRLPRFQPQLCRQRRHRPPHPNIRLYRNQSVLPHVVPVLLIIMEIPVLSIKPPTRSRALKLVSMLLLQPHLRHPPAARLHKACRTMPRSNAGYTSRGHTNLSVRIHRISPPSRKRKSSHSEPKLALSPYRLRNHPCPIATVVCPPRITHYVSPISPFAEQSESYPIPSRMKRSSSLEDRLRRLSEPRRRVPRRSLMEHRPTSSQRHQAS